MKKAKPSRMELEVRNTDKCSLVGLKFCSIKFTLRQTGLLNLYRELWLKPETFNSNFFSQRKVAKVM